MRFLTILAFGLLVTALAPSRQAHADQFYFDNENGLIVCPFGAGTGNGTVCNGDANYSGAPSLLAAPPAATTFTLSGTEFINYVATYHFCASSTTQACSNTASGYISTVMEILDSGNQVVATFVADDAFPGSALPNTHPNLIGDPNVTLGPGTYTLVDTQRASTWSYNNVTTGPATINNTVYAGDPCNLNALCSNSIYGYNDNNAGFAIIGDVSQPYDAPEPASLALLGSAALGLGSLRRRLRRTG